MLTRFTYLWSTFSVFQNVPNFSLQLPGTQVPCTSLHRITSQSQKVFQKVDVSFLLGEYMLCNKRFNTQIYVGNC